MGDLSVSREFAGNGVVVAGVGRKTMVDVLSLSIAVSPWRQNTWDCTACSVLSRRAGNVRIPTLPCTSHLDLFVLDPLSLVGQNGINVPSTIGRTVMGITVSDRSGGKGGMDLGREDCPAAVGGTVGTETAMGVGGAVTDEMIPGRREGR